MRRELEIQIKRNGAFHNVTDVFHLYNNDGIFDVWDATQVHAVVFEKSLERYQLVEKLARYCATSRDLPQLIVEEMNVNKSMASNVRFLNSPFTVVKIDDDEEYQLSTPTICGEDRIRFMTYGKKWVFDITLMLGSNRYSLHKLRLIGHPIYAPIMEILDSDEGWVKKSKRIVMEGNEIMMRIPLLLNMGNKTGIKDRIERALTLQYIDILENSKSFISFLNKTK